MSPAWIADGCAEVRRLHDAGDSEGAALLAGDIEAEALGKPARLCSVCDERALLSRPWCLGCAPCFIPRPDANLPWQAWNRIDGKGNHSRLTSAQIIEIQERRRAGEKPTRFAHEYGIHWSHACAISRGGRRQAAKPSATVAFIGGRNG